MAKRYELSDASWGLTKDLASPEQKWVAHAVMIVWYCMESCGFRARALLGVTCRNALGLAQRCISVFRDWRDDGTFSQMLDRLHIRLNQEGLIDLDTWMIDSTAVRATRASSGAGKGGPEEPLDHALGRSRGRLTTKIHMVCDANGVPLRSSCHRDKPAISPTPSRYWSRYEFPASRGDHANAVFGYWHTKAMTQNTCATTVIVTECSR